MKSLVSFILATSICGPLMCSSLGCGSAPQQLPPIEAREAENVAPEMLDRALQGLHSQDAKLQMSGLKFLESFPEIKKEHVARIEELAASAKDAKVRAQAAKILK